MSADGNRPAARHAIGMPAPGTRLGTLLDAIPQGASVADIACDHGRLAVAVARRDPAVRVIASDLRELPLASARRRIADHGLGERIELRHADGLAGLAPGEVDVICIAGLGGVTIAAILAAAPEVVLGCRRLVLQPLSGVARLRLALHALVSDGATPHLVAESALVEGRFAYDVLVAEPRPGPDPSYPVDPLERDVALHGGPFLLAARNPVAAARWRQEVGRLEGLLRSVRGTADSLAVERIPAIERQLGLATAICERFHRAGAVG